MNRVKNPSNKNKNLFWIDAAHVKFLGLHSYLLYLVPYYFTIYIFQRKASILAFPSQFLPRMHEDSHLEQKFAIKDMKKRKIAVTLEIEAASPIFYPLILPHKNLSLAQLRSGEVLFTIFKFFPIHQMMFNAMRDLLKWTGLKALFKYSYFVFVFALDIMFYKILKY